MADKEYKLQRIEEELAGYIKADRKSWVRIYQLMSEVETDKLYMERTDTPSFTSWVNALAEELHVHVSLLWARLKAGRTYSEYEERAVRNGRTVASLDKVVVSPDSLNLCEKVAGRNACEMDHLIDRVLAGELTRGDLRQAARAKRRAVDIDTVDGKDRKVRTRHNRLSAADRTDDVLEKITAADIIMALGKSSWLKKEREDPYFRHVYVMLPEFRIPSGTSRHARKIDAMVFETFTAMDYDEVVIRGFEIKISRSDLLGDHKMQEYTDFCDYFYIVIPAGSPEILEAAESVRRPSWGVITVTKDGDIKVVHEPERMDAVFRDKSLANGIIKLL